MKGRHLLLFRFPPAHGDSSAQQGRSACAEPDRARRRFEPAGRAEVLAHLQRALEAADRSALPPVAAARIQQAIDACLLEAGAGNANARSGPRRS